jgi:hypothetical protein
MTNMKELEILSTEIPSKESIKKFQQNSLYMIHFFAMLPIQLIMFSLSIYNHNPLAASAFLTIMILHIDVVLIPTLIEPIITNRNLYHVIHFIATLPVYAIISFGLTYIYPTLAFVPLILMILHLGICVNNVIEKLLERFFFIEKSFKVYEYTKKAKFLFKNNRWYLILFNENGIEIYDVLKGDTFIRQKENFTLGEYGEITLKYYDTFIMTYSNIVDTKGEKFLIKVWNINKLVLECITDKMNKFYITKNKKYFICCNISSYVTYYNRGDYENWHNYYSIKIWEIKNNQVIYDNIYSTKYGNGKFTDEDLKLKIKDILKSYKEIGELYDLYDLYELEYKSPPYPIAIIYPSCKQNYNGYMEYDMTKVKQYKFKEKATYINTKIPLKELK